jgi:hypothetical protein
MKASRGLLDATDEVMALIADNLAFLGHHGVAALGTGIKKLLGLVDRGILFELPAEIE